MEIPVPFGSRMGLPGPIGLGKSHSDWFISINVQFISINVHVLKRDHGLFLLVYMYWKENAFMSLWPFCLFQNFDCCYSFVFIVIFNRLHIKNNVVIKSLSVTVASPDSSYMPEVIWVSAGKNFRTLRKIKEVTIPR